MNAPYVHTHVGMVANNVQEKEKTEDACMYAPYAMRMDAPYVRTYACVLIMYTKKKRLKTHAPYAMRMDAPYVSEL
jgi:hypothetical protein